ncbi:MAG: hypothetical protein AB8F94_04395 [Saprospiraceae bacterium]
MDRATKIIQEFASFSLQEIIEYSDNLIQDYFKNKKPEELVKTKYQYGQTIILKGDSNDFKNLIEFWLGCISWYSDGEDSFYQILEFNDIVTHKHWQASLNIDGTSRKLAEYKFSKIQRTVNFVLGSMEITNSLEIDPRWNDHKVLFSDGIDYYLYFFWTGE